MSKNIRIASAQLNPVMGDLAANLQQTRTARAQAAQAGADLLVCAELGVVGYPPEDLVLKPALVRDCRKIVEKLAKDTDDGGPALIIGAPWLQDGQLYNAVLLLDAGEIQAVRFKAELPNYRVFDEKRVFCAGPIPEPVNWRGIRLGLPICEDIWLPTVPMALAEQGAELLICINGSPFRKGIRRLRHAAFEKWMKPTGLPMVFVNQVGGQDELVFDGASFSSDHTGKIVQQLPQFVTDISYANWTKKSGQWRCSQANITALPDAVETRWRAMALGLADYVNKNGFPGVVLGLSGGIDSAISAALAVDALGAERVWCVMMPSKHTSQQSLIDAEASVLKLGCRYDSISIEPMVDAFTETLAPIFAGKEADTTEENLQSRTRAVILMGLSNKFGHMLLTTGNKSEMAVGYATLYGDMCGGFNALKDVYKTDVFELANWRNANHPKGLFGPTGEVVPQNVIDKPPSAELRDNQRDDDSLPPYPVLDDMLFGLVEEDADVADLVAKGHTASEVERIEHLLYLAEYKRRQAPPGVKLGPRNFGRDRRYPITNKYRDRNKNK
ncbi:NAD synthetase / Glutamine amidotransferase chain of NAD synthetase [hydrothermal vent metagenome]|uniref:NAD(+) synthase (glutamine-hydrolyzing) n=1 Tax=hydrothermal vent metagenome TaxID=652676 RepID=A0A3B0RFB8_9ZZZZ